MKHLNLSNNPLKSKLTKTVGPSQNDAQCQSATANTLQHLKDNKSDSKKQGDYFLYNIILWCKIFIYNLKIIFFIDNKQKKKDKKRQKTSLNNKIKDLSKGLSKLKESKHLNLSNNPFKSELAKTVGPSQNIVQCQSDTVNALRYLKNIKSDPKSKVIIFYIKFYN